MTNVQTRNVKLHARAIRILKSEAGLSEAEAQATLDRADGKLPVALVMSQTGRSREEVEAALARSQGVISEAIGWLKLR